ncbi:integral membrane PTH11 [Fusarium albosuccineum]|uniref:Integral membrane PTH11 n=1 Tax=Fusarium albosuccineum TaxID=1237068 RepID=A0A8H4LL54_9HYPO|nr:integral membrane PTH11 [Fusarium albosuccineum]
MDSSQLWARTGPPPYPDVTKIPTPPLQEKGLVVLFLFPILSIIVVSMRIYIRFSTRQLGLANMALADDYLVLAALVSDMTPRSPVHTDIEAVIKLNYWGWRMDDVPEFDPRAGYWWNFLVQMFYNPVLALVKASILVFLLRLGGHKQSVRWAIHSLNIFNALHAVAIFFTALFQCLPMEANWDFSLRENPDTKCIDNSFHVIASCITIFTDFLILALPFWIFLGLTMPWAAKLAVIGVFLLGSVVAIVGIIRVVGIYDLLLTTPDPGEDTFYSISPVWSIVETNLAIICASVPALRPLFRRWFPKLFGGSSRKTTGTPYGNNYASGTRGTNGLRSTNHDGAIDIRLKDLRGSRAHHTEIRSISPNGSEEEIMTYNGIMRTTNVDVAYENTSKASVSEPRTSSELKYENKPSEARYGV